MTNATTTCRQPALRAFSALVALLVMGRGGETGRGQAPEQGSGGRSEDGVGGNVENVPPYDGSDPRNDPRLLEALAEAFRLVS